MIQRITAIALLAVVACGGPAEPAALAPPIAPSVTPPSSPPPPSPPSSTACDGAIDAPALLARHAAEYGTADAVRASLPVTVRGTTTLEGKTGPTELVVSATAHRESALVAGLFGASGIDAEGAWGSEISNGRVLRRNHNGREGGSDRLRRWLVDRGYIAFDPLHDQASCAMRDGQAVVRITYARTDLPSPTVEIDPKTAALLSVTSLEHGRAERLTFDAWHPKDARGVRWLKGSTTYDEVAKPVRDTYEVPTAGLACAPLVEGRLSATASASDCLAPPQDSLGVAWPASGVVRVPMSKAHKSFELLLRVRAGGRDVWALLDSGASITCIDATTKLASSFTPLMSLDGAGSTSKVRFGLGSLDRVDVGGLAFTHLPVASVPIPALDDFGERRPELILGFAAFASAAIRVDYAHDVVVFAKDASAVVPPHAVPIDVELVHNSLMADVLVEGQPAFFELDTGDSGAADLYAAWARGHGFPGARPTTSIRGKFGAGNDETEEKMTRLARVDVGPVHVSKVLSRMSDPPGTGTTTGLMGNQIFSRCASVTFDTTGRRVWIEPPCDRKIPEPKMGWRFEKDIVKSLAPGGSAEQGGVQVGDRVVAIDGKPVKIGDDAWMLVGTGPEGSVMKLTVERAATTKDLAITLRAILP